MTALDSPMSTIGTEDSPKVAAISEALMSWFDAHGRTFSWRVSNDPYYVLVSEILLKKTGANAVESFVPGFIKKYPSAMHLAHAIEGKLAGDLSVLGLGSQRASQLKRLGRQLLELYDGHIPSEIEQLSRLSGVGQYTSAMVASTCFGVGAPAVDTNVARVVCRVLGLNPTRAEARRSPNVWEAAGSLLQSEGNKNARLSWAILDLGAVICSSRNPKCMECPLVGLCEFSHTQERVRGLAVSSGCGKVS